MKIDYRKYIFLISIVILTIIFLFIFIRADNNMMSRIEELFRLIWKTDEEIVYSLTFELAEEQPLLGSGENYVLIDNYENRWLFKLHEYPSSFYSKIEKAVSKWGKVCGLNVPYVHMITLPINGRITQGTIQRMIPESITLHNFDCSKLSSSQISELLRQQVLDYFVDNYGTAGDNFLVSLKTGEIYGIDKDSSFDVNEKLIRQNDSVKRFTGEGVYLDIWNKYIKGESDINISYGLVIIKFISEIRDELVSEIFGSILQEHKKVTFDSIDTLIDKKKGLFRDFIGFYRMASEKRKKILEIPNKNELNIYKRQILKKLKNEVEDRKSWLRKIDKKIMQEQRNIDVVSSESAWLLIEDKIFSPYCKNRVIHKKNYVDTIKDLKVLRNNSESIAEKLAITIYILKVRELFLAMNYNFADPYNWAKLRVTLHPKLINTNSLKDRCSAIIKKGIFQDMEAEFYYAMYLSYILQGQYNQANYYVLKAQEKGSQFNKDILREIAEMVIKK